MTPPDDSQLLPQRLEKVMATIHSRLRSDVEVQDYHFLIDPVDHHHLTTNGHFLETHNNISQLDQLKEAFPDSNISVHFNPITGEMSVSTLGKELQFELQYLLVSKLRHYIATHPQAADGLQARNILSGNVASEVPHCLVFLYRSDHGVIRPSLTISATTIGNKKKAAKSTLAHVMTRHPSLQTMVRLDFGGLTMDKSIDEAHHERRVQRIANLSSVLTWTRDEHGNIVSTCESLSKADGELRLCLPGGNNNDSSGNASGQGIEVTIKHSELLDTIRMVGECAPLGGAGNPRPLQSSMVPLFSPLLGHHGFRASSSVNMAAHVTRLLGFGNTTATATSNTGIAPHATQLPGPGNTTAAATTTATSVLGGYQGARVFRPHLYMANQARIAVASWSRLLARLPRKL